MHSRCRRADRSGERPHTAFALRQLRASAPRSMRRCGGSRAGRRSHAHEPCRRLLVTAGGAPARPHHRAVTVHALASRTRRVAADRGARDAARGKAGGCVMNVFSRLRFIRLILAVGAALRAVFWGAAVALSLLAITGIADSLTPLAVDARALLLRLSL